MAFLTTDTLGSLRVDQGGDIEYGIVLFRLLLSQKAL